MNNFKEYDPEKQTLRERHQMLIGSVAPRPIGFTTSINKNGQINLAPFSFHNAFSSNPPVVGISPAYSGRTGKAKDTLNNILETKEFTISVISYNMMEQMNICSAEYGSTIDEFEMSGFTKYPSKKVLPPGVSESPVIFECTFLKHIQFSKEPAGGNLLLGKIIHIHAKDDIFNNDGYIDPLKIDQIGRLGLNWYTRAKEGLYEMKPPVDLPVGFSAIPDFIKNNSLFTKQLLCQLASISLIPENNSEIENIYADKTNEELLDLCIDNLSINKINISWNIINILKMRIDV